MKRIIALPLALKFMMPDGRKYDLGMLADAHVAFSFGEHNRILKDEYGQHWYHRQIRMGEDFARGMLEVFENSFARYSSLRFSNSSRGHQCRFYGLLFVSICDNRRRWRGYRLRDQYIGCHLQLHIG